MYTWSKPNEQFWQIGQTEIISNNHNPDFVKAIPIDYYFERSLFIKFEVEDYDDDGTSDHLGSASTDVASIITADGGTLRLTLENKGQ